MALKDTLDPDTGQDDIDRIVDALLERPDRVSDIKTLLRNKMYSPDVVRVAHPLESAPEEARANDIDDFWDNVPV